MLCNAGNGESGLGVAGAHFDRHLLKLKLGSDAKAELRDELLVALDEKKKRSKNSALLLENYLLDASPQERVEPIYSLSSSHGPPVSISFDDICEAFAPVRDGIGRVLTEIREKAEREGHPIDKVILVGGFSQFPLVQQAVGEFFGEDVFNDPKLIDLVTLSSDDMAFAISYGACLVAADRVQVTEIYEHTIGIVAYSAQTGERTELELIRARRSLNALEETAFYVAEDGQRRRFKITSGSVEANIFIKLSGSDDREDKLVRRLSLEDVPNSHVPGNHWFLGTFVDKSKIPYLVLKDEKYGEEIVYPLGDLIPPIIVKD